jgi:hypothetical protein
MQVWTDACRGTEIGANVSSQERFAIKDGDCDAGHKRYPGKHIFIMYKSINIVCKILLFSQ